MTAVAELFGGAKVFNKKGDQVDLAKHCAGKIVGIYFSAHWCGPCRNFTPLLRDFYNKYSAIKKFEVIFISSDSNNQSFQEYYNEMPWLYLKFDESTKKNELNEKYDVNGIPTLVILNGDSGEVINLDATDPSLFEESCDFPW